MEAEALPAGQRISDTARPVFVASKRGVALHAQVLLAAERSAGRDLRDAHALLRDAEEGGDLAPVLPAPWPCEYTWNDSVLARDDERRLRLEERVLDELGAEGLGDDVRRVRERGVHVAALDAGDGEHVAVRMEQRRACGHGLERVGDGLEHLVLDVDERSGLAGGAL